jgi:hypothetical protein|tara:strand:- start:2138 stop:2605 length:468 start_codon:yes stop_codon:yes gene_type:complete
MSKKLRSIVFGLLILTSSSFAGCVREAMPLEDEEIGELSVIVTLDFAERGNETANLETRLTNGSITFDPVMVSNNTSAYRVMEALQIRENFSIDVTYYVGMGAFIHTIDGVSGASDYSTYWGFNENGEVASVGASSLMITSNTTLSWVMLSSTDY